MHLPPHRRLSPAPSSSIHTLALMLVTAGLVAAAMPNQAASPAPALMLAKVYPAGIALQDFWVSEKYDGVRGYWDGEKLFTRSGLPIYAPAWFTADWPRVPMDGELWAGRGRFAKAVSTVRQQAPDDTAWHEMRFMVFDLPAHGGRFDDRLLTLNRLVPALGIDWVQAVAQSKVSNDVELKKRLYETVRLGGEGLALHRGASFYTGQRNGDLLKLKTHEDAEARVISHIPGKGKYAGKLGALLVEMPAADDRPARRFKLGTGLSDVQRLTPPPVGSQLTYRFSGLNDSGIPRFASFMRVLEE